MIDCEYCGMDCPPGICLHQDTTLDNWGNSPDINPESYSPEELKQSRMYVAAPDLYRATLANAAYYKWINGHYNGQDRAKMYEVLKELGWVPTQEYYWSFMVRLTEEALKRVDLNV